MTRYLRSTLTPAVLAAALLLTSGGCGADVPPVSAATPLAPVARTSPPTQPQPAAAPPASTPSAVAPEQPFQPPYPHRTELFLPPDLSTMARLPSTGDGPSVVVRGFANLDGPRVVLEIDDTVQILAVGEEYAQLQVVAITPPRVTLQRRGERWTAQLTRSR